MNLTRLMVLGTLARHGPTHGHQVRRLAEVSNVGEWGGVSVGALYRELRAMESEGLVEAVRTERVGRRPARTVYAITADGALELSSLRERAIRSTQHGHDPLGVALTFAFDHAAAGDIRRALDDRRARVALEGEELRLGRQQGLAQGCITELDAAVMRRGELHVAAELRWHEEIDAMLAQTMRHHDSPRHHDGSRHRRDAGQRAGAATAKDREIEILLDTEPKVNGTEGMTDSGHHRGARTCAHVHHQETQGRGGLRRRPAR